MELNFDSYIDRYLKYNLVTPELLESPIVNCCDEEGKLKDDITGSIFNKDTFYQRNVDKLDFNEILFCQYLQGIKAVLDNDAEYKALKTNTEKQQYINSLLKGLMVITDNSLIKSTNARIEFDKEHLKKIYYRHNFPDAFLDRLPYVVSYVALKRGFEMYDKEQFFMEKDNPKFSVFINFYKGNKKLKDADFILSVGEKIGIDYEKYLNKDKELA